MTNIVRSALVHLTALAPFHAQLLMNYEVLADKSIPTAAVVYDIRTGKVRVKVNPEFLGMLQPEQRPFVLAHEAEHIVRQFVARMPAKEHVAIFNIAQDFVINANLARAGLLSGVPTISINEMLGRKAPAPKAGALPFRIPCDSRALDMTEEQIYEMLLEKQEEVRKKLARACSCGQQGGGRGGDAGGAGDGQQKGRQQGGGKGRQKGDRRQQSGAGAGAGEFNRDDYRGVLVDEHDHVGGDGTEVPLDHPAVPESVRQKVLRDIASAAAATPEKQRGTLPAGVPELLEQLRGWRPRVDWRRKLARFIGAAGNLEDWSYAQPNRHDLARGATVLMPGVVRYGLETLGIVIDTSGSMSKRELEAGVAELAALVRLMKPGRIVVVECDAIVQRVTVLDGQGLEDFHLPEVKGRGGTAFEPALEELKRHRPTVAVVLTDGAGDDPERPPFPVLWLTTSGYCSAGFGEVAKLEV